MQTAMRAGPTPKSLQKELANIMRIGRQAAEEKMAPTMGTRNASAWVCSESAAQARMKASAGIVQT
jgi:hypothetical protein